MPPLSKQHHKNASYRLDVTQWPPIKRRFSFTFKASDRLKFGFILKARTLTFQQKHKRQMINVILRGTGGHREAHLYVLQEVGDLVVLKKPH